ncbi:MAG: DegT/DnrJ/EryC1/StrS family aminotransferase [Armatimonadetes bacterium]|nr:DegT/DnrJ/EryC1/StrS family aminotransferase [Armatimonadota bacterium]
MGEASQLAINGGQPITTEPFPPWPYFTPEMIEAATEPLKTGKCNYWTGPLGMKFEEEFAHWCGAKYGISTSSGTTALHTALGGLGIGPGDEVIVPSYTFIASSMCVPQAGAIPVFADVEPQSHVISAEDIEAKISDQTRAVIVVHLYGEVCDMDAINTVAKKHGLFVIEDCAQAHGAEYDGKKVGTIGTIGAFSFCQSKTFTTGGEGGCVITDDEDVAWNCRAFRDHGYDVQQRMKLLELEAKLPYIHNTLGYNFRMTEMQSAIGLEALKIIDSWNLANRRRNGEYLIERLSDLPQIVKLPTHNERIKNGFWLFPIIVDIDALSCDIRQLAEALTAEGIPNGPVQWPQSYKEKCYSEHHGFGPLNYPFDAPFARPEAVDYANTYCPNAAWVEERCFWVPVHPTYELEHMKLIADGIEKVLQAYAV